MNNFTLRAIGNLYRSPELVAGEEIPYAPYAKFCLVGYDSDARDAETLRRVETRLWFVAHGSMGEEIARNAKKGDQLFVEAAVQTLMESRSVYEHTFIVTAFRFGHVGRTSRREAAE